MPPYRPPRPFRRTSEPPRPTQPTAAPFVAECVPGLEAFAVAELERVPGVTLAPPPRPPLSGEREGGEQASSPPPHRNGGGAGGGGRSGEVRIAYAGPWPALLNPRTVVAVDGVIASGLPRPNGLLDDGRFRQI